MGEGMEKKTVLVTGATGFLGEYVVRRLLPDYRVLAMGRNRERGAYLERLGARFCEADFTEKRCARFFHGVDYVIHAGALSTVWGAWNDFYRTNAEGTARVARLCHRCHVRRLVYISSPSIYTEKRDRYQIRETDAPERNNLNFYIRSKLLAEREVMRWHARGLETVILRPRGLIGIGDTSLVPRLLRANGRTGIPLFGGGRFPVDLTSVENAAQACVLAMTAEGASGETFNITNGEPTSFRTLLETFLESIGERPRYLRLPFGLVYGLSCCMERIWRLLRLAGEPPLTRYTVCTLGFAQTMDIGRAEKILGYRPEKTLEQSIREFGRWWRETAGGASPQGDDIGRAPADIPVKKGHVTQVTLYQCGYCTNRTGLLYRGAAWEERRFPATAALIRHTELGNILYDTGYSRRIFGYDFRLWLYRLLNPVTLDAGGTIAERLQADGIDPASVGHIILSHAHPDHIGGLSDFSEYTLTAFPEVHTALERPCIRNLTVRSLLPEAGHIRARRIPQRRLTGHFLCRYFAAVYDLFGDGSILGIRLDGHCRGQMGLFLPDRNLFLAADACWGRDLIRATPRMRFPARLIQNDFPAMLDTLRRICRMKREHPEITLVFTHQKGKERTYV